MPVFLIVVLAILAVVFGPILVIWSLNTLFPALAIGYGLAEWFAVAVLCATIRGSVTVNSK